MEVPVGPSALERLTRAVLAEQTERIALLSALDDANARAPPPKCPRSWCKSCEIAWRT
jgi:hypothetical protein